MGTGIFKLLSFFCNCQQQLNPITNWIRLSKEIETRHVTQSFNLFVRSQGMPGLPGLSGLDGQKVSACLKVVTM